MKSTHQHYRARIKSSEAELQPQFDHPGLENRVVDPVCFMRVLTRSPFEAVHEGRKYHFCSERCLREFRKDPEWYFPRENGPILEKIKTFKNVKLSEIIFATRQAERGNAHDPVCHMIVTPDSPHWLEHQGQIYQFCTIRCLGKFRDWPNRYANASDSKR